MDEPAKHDQSNGRAMFLCVPSHRASYSRARFSGVSANRIQRTTSLKNGSYHNRTIERGRIWSMVLISCLFCDIDAGLCFGRGHASAYWLRVLSTYRACSVIRWIKSIRRLPRKKLARARPGKRNLYRCAVLRDVSKRGKSSVVNYEATQCP